MLLSQDGQTHVTTLPCLLQSSQMAQRGRWSPVAPRHPPRSVLPAPVSCHMDADARVSCHTDSEKMESAVPQ